MAVTGKTYRLLGLVVGIYLIAMGAGLSVEAAGLPVSAMTRNSADNDSTDAQADPRATDPYRAVAGLSDEEVRARYIEELERATPDTMDEDRVMAPKSFFTGLIERLESVSTIFYWRLMALKANSAKFPHDIEKAMDYLAHGRGPVGLILMAGSLLLIFAAGYGVEWLIRRTVSTGKGKDRPAAPMEGLYIIWGALLKILPELIGIVIFSITAFILFVIFFGTDPSGIRPLFLTVLITVFIARMITAISRMIVSPWVPELRLMPLDDAAAGHVHRVVRRFAWILTIAYTSFLLLRYAGLQGDSSIFFVIFWGTLVIVMIGVTIWRQRRFVAMQIRGCMEDECDSTSWFKDKLAAMWHLLALGYLFLVWVLWSGRLVIFGPRMDRAFIMSLLVVPIFFLLDRAGGWLVDILLDSLQSADKKLPESGDAPGDAAERQSSPRRIMRQVIRVTVLVLMILLFLNLWGVNIPLVDPLLESTADIVITLVIAYGVWRFINGYITRKLAESIPEPEEEGEKEDDEWGGTATQDRSYTLLPILRKFFATALLVMVTLIVISSMGINIGPLLAGAGVVGLALGFGAQKLVADVLSGIFYLVDDAFRVGEYITAGSVSGVVEAITLRNVMLRHHRGMLQIVPFSDLGSITNFMRGGIVVKFNLQFPYDTNIDKVRKIIKKVGKAMLEDPEFSNDFIKPVKSQGVREVGDSVMNIRVKFTARPGSHFVIRREAYKRITEALEAKGIRYAHRKVIVEVAAPDGSQAPQSTDASTAPALDPHILHSAAAGAAEHVLNADNTMDKKSRTKKRDDPMG